MIFGEPDTVRFIHAVQKLKQQQRRRERQTRIVKQRVRALVRKQRDH